MSRVKLQQTHLNSVLFKSCSLKVIRRKGSEESNRIKSAGKIHNEALKSLQLCSPGKLFKDNLKVSERIVIQKMVTSSFSFH